MRLGLASAVVAAVGLASPAVPAWATTEVPAVAQGLGAGPLQGPLASPSSNSAIVCRPVRRVVHRRARVVPRPAPVLAAAPPVVPLIPLVPYYRPVYVYRPLLPFVAYRPFFYRPVYRPFFYGRVY